LHRRSPPLAPLCSKLAIAITTASSSLASGAVCRYDKRRLITEPDRRAVEAKSTEDFGPAYTLATAVSTLGGAHFTERGKNPIVANVVVRPRTLRLVLVIDQASAR
jgi:hypothetical protein